ncbi:MAG: hypothetical protein GY797_01390 [Deltaproteobacteria bacterium]|nr:hypothetical protein [Deltaproteobacteria bacterium]
MSEEWGPFLTYSVVALGIPLACAAAWNWAGGHYAWIIVNNKKPSWWVDDPNDPDTNYKPYQIYLYKGIAWTINIFWLLWFLSQSGCGTWVDQACYPIFGNVALLDIGAITFELALFFVLTGLYRWYVWRK